MTLFSVCPILWAYRTTQAWIWWVPYVFVSQLMGLLNFCFTINVFNFWCLFVYLYCTWNWNLFGESLLPIFSLLFSPFELIFTIYFLYMFRQCRRVDDYHVFLSVLFFKNNWNSVGTLDLIDSTYSNCVWTAVTTGPQH